MDRSSKKASRTQSQSRTKRYVNHGQIQEKGIKYTVTIKTQKDKSRKRESSTLSQSRPKRYVNHGQIY